MNPHLEAFLGAEDLSEALMALRWIHAFDGKDAAAIRLILEQWRDAQAVSNLLFHPTLIPEDVRVTSLFRGLAERQRVYYVLAAVVGLQSINRAELSAVERIRVTEELLAIIRKTKGILAQRASVSLQEFISEDNAPRIFALWSHPDDTVWHNLRAWLCRTFQNRGVEAVTAAVRQSGLSEEVQRRLVEDFTEFLCKPANFDNWLSELYGCIPNLRDVEHRS
jgi:hypothetical protein